MIITGIDPVRTGGRIRESLEEKNISASRVAEELGLSSTNAVYKWLRGDCLPSIDNFYALSQLLQRPIDDLIIGQDGRQTSGKNEGTHYAHAA